MAAASSIWRAVMRVPSAVHRMKALIIGNSHTHALKMGAAGFVGSAQFEVHRLAVRPDKLSAEVMHPRDAERIVRQLGPSDVLVVSFGGTMHNPVSLVRHPEPFDVLADGEEANGVQIITQSTLRSAFALPDWSNRRKIEYYKAMTTAKVLHIATPPPMADHAFIMERRISYRGGSFTKDGLNPPPLRLKVWAIEMQTLAGICGDCGVGFLYPPADALTPEGYLSRDCYADDAAHANERYGRLVLEQLDAATCLKPVAG